MPEELVLNAISLNNFESASSSNIEPCLIVTVLLYFTCICFSVERTLTLYSWLGPKFMKNIPIYLVDLAPRQSQGSSWRSEISFSDLGRFLPIFKICTCFLQLTFFSSEQGEV